MRVVLVGTDVTDAGLEQLKDLTQLRWLDLGGTRITDVGLEHLKGLTQLEVLSLDGTEVDHGRRAGAPQGLDATPELDLWHTK